MSPNPPSLPYGEPGIVTILVLGSFLLLLNVVNYLLDKLVYCGLIGQILIGVAWGQPGAGWLSREVQDAVMQLGYLGLILIVYEGGLSTNLKTLRANLALSASVALIGISAPIALSFTLLSILPITPLQAFAAGAALCSTSLGTTFTVLSTSGLVESRLGVVLSSAAMMDDVIGLVMVQVISNLGQGSSNLDAVTVVRPVLVSLAFAVCVPLACRWIVQPLAKHAHEGGLVGKDPQSITWANGRQAAFVVHTLILTGLVTGASYAGTSNLFTAYLAGAAISWLSDLLEQLRETGGRKAAVQPTGRSGSRSFLGLRRVSEQSQSRESNAVAQPNSKHEANKSGLSIYEVYYRPAVELVLKPFFFASIGFSIPISRMFQGHVVWRGFVYAALMTLGKLLCGITLVRIPGILDPLRTGSAKLRPTKSPAQEPKTGSPSNSSNAPDADAAPGTTKPAPSAPRQANTSSKRKSVPKPRSLYPPLMLGSAMVARGEIGFLISSVAESKGVFGSTNNGESSETFLIVTWAILICTILGPLSVGLMVRRVKKLQQVEREKKTGKDDPLGIWGLISPVT